MGACRRGTARPGRAVLVVVLHGDGVALDTAARSPWKTRAWALEGTTGHGSLPQPRAHRCAPNAAPPPLCAVGNVGGFLGPYLIGLMLASTQNSFALPTVMMGLCLASAGLLVLLLPALLGLPPGVAGVRHHRK